MPENEVIDAGAILIATYANLTLAEPIDCFM